MTDAGGEFDAFYRQEWPRITALGWSLTGSWAIAEELTQDAFADAYRRWPMVGGLERPGAWVRRAVINRAASYHRRRRVEARGVFRLGLRSRVGEHAASDDAGVTDGAFWESVRALPERQAQCVTLYYLEDRSVADIAAILECSQATVKVHLHRGRQRLATTLDAEGSVIPLTPIAADDEEDDR